MPCALRHWPLTTLVLPPFAATTDRAFPQNPNLDIELIVDPVSHLHVRIALRTFFENRLCFANIRRLQNLWEANQRLIEK
jgi:hypothetical protein